MKAPLPFCPILISLFSPLAVFSGEIAKTDLQSATHKGIAWLEKHQSETGSWSDEENPALTALPVSAILQNPARDPRKPLPESARKGIDFLLTQVKKDGGIYGKGLATYNTALCINALVQSGEKAHLPVIARARRLLVNQQQDFDKRGVNDNLFDGGIGYGGTYAHSDLSNTHLAIEALYLSKQALADTEYDESREFDLDWDAAIEFVSRCQNSESTIQTLGGWAGLREEDKGGFVYFPGNTKSDEIELPGGKIALRSYGSMSYAGLLSFIYADMDRNDPRIQAVLEWLGRNFSIDENPGMGAQGLYYYFHTMSKALSLAGMEALVLADGARIDWKSALARKLIDTQKEDGSWINEGSNRWWENDPVLVTSYAVLSLQHTLRSMEASTSQ